MIIIAVKKSQLHITRSTSRRFTLTGIGLITLTGIGLIVLATTWLTWLAWLTWLTWLTWLSWGHGHFHLFSDDSVDDEEASATTCRLVIANDDSIVDS